MRAEWIPSTPGRRGGPPAREPGRGFLYRANGLNLRSEIELPELHAGTANPDVVLRYGEVPEALERPAMRGPRFESAPGEYLLEVAGVARYWVRNGREVVVAPHPGATVDEVRVFILSSVMGVLAHENGFLPVHASAVEVDGECVLFAGQSGCGKSTLAAAFHARGHPVVADDICAVSLDAAGRPVVHPGYRHLKLWGDALERLGEDPGGRRRLRDGMEKYSVPVRTTGGAEPLPVRRIFVLTSKLAEEVKLSPLSGRSKMASLFRETYRFRLLRGLGRRSEHFVLCEALGRRTPVILVDRPLFLSQLDRLVDTIQESL